MKKMINLFLVLSIIGMIAQPFSALASVPKIINYHGLLKDSSGNFLTGTYSMKFRIYGAQSGGTSLWNETVSGVSVSSGRFSVDLGGVTPIALDFTSDYWLSVEVGNDGEMSPRQRLTAVGYALMAENVVNSFTQSQHDSLSHMNVPGVKSAQANIAKTNFKLDAYSQASANSLGDLIIDTFMDNSGINAGASSNYVWRGASDYDVTTGGGGIDSYAVLMLHMNGTNASTTFTDSSTSAKSMTANGNVQIATAQNKFGTASGTFDGTGDYVSAADSSDWSFGSGDFTIDGWMRFNGTVAGSGEYILVGQGDSSSNNWNVYTGSGSMTFVVATGGSNSIVLDVTSGTFSSNTWYHFAIVRSGTSLKAYINGTQLGSTVTTSSSVGDYSGALKVGVRSYDGVKGFNGWIDELRVSKGIARWTSNFTPPSQEYSTTGSGTATVISNSFSEPAAPKEAMIVADETLNSGSITYYVSRNGGTNWTQAAKDTVVNINSQPSGTQVRWKAVLTGDAELDSVGVALNS